MDLKSLTAEQKAELKRQLAAEEKAEKENAKKQIEDYNTLKEAQVAETFKTLQDVSGALEIAKSSIFEQFGAVLKMKQELYGITDADMHTQQSHTFTSADGKTSIVIGSNVVDKWSDDVAVGIARVTNWLDKLSTDDKSEQMVSIIKDLLKPNKDGMLKASRILDLSKKAAEFGDNELIEAVDFIRDQYRPSKTSTFVKAKFTDSDGNIQWLPLSMSAV